MVTVACGDSDDADTTGGTGTTAAGDTTAASVTTEADPEGTTTVAQPDDSAAGATLEGPVWSLQPAGSIALPDGVTVTATFGGGTVSGSAGCNRYTASYEVDGDALTIGPAATTQMLCEPDVMTAEEAFLTAFAGVDGFAVTAGTLELTTTSGDPMVFDERVQSVVGSWNVVSYLNADATAIVSVILGTSLTAEFDDAGGVSGTAGCNRFSGGYQTDGTTIAIGPLTSTFMACTEPEGIMDQEQGFLAAMQAATSFTLEGTTLVLFDAEGRRAVELQPAG